MKKNLLIILCSCVCHFSFAQSLSHSVIGSTGEAFHSSNGSIDWTLGEIATETYSLAGKIFTQGFQQPEVKASGARFSIEVYPNPVSDSVKIKISKKGSYRVEVYDLLGKKVMDQNINLIVNEVPIQIDFRDFVPALYILRIFNSSTGNVFSIKIEKI